MILLTVETDSVWTWSHFLFGITYAIVASFIFIFLLLSFLRPRIKISPEICCQKDPLDNSEKLCYLFKIINTSFFSAYDVYVELSSLVSYPVKDGRNFRYTSIPLKNNKLNFIAPYKFRWRKKNYGEFACLFRCYEDLHKIYENEVNSVSIQVTLRHGLTGLSKVFNMEYALVSSIKHGHFAFGNNFNIV